MPVEDLANQTPVRMIFTSGWKTILPVLLVLLSLPILFVMFSSIINFYWLDLWERKTWPTRHLSGWSLPVDDGLYYLPYLSYLSYLSYFQVLMYNYDYSNRFAMVEDLANQTPVRMIFTSWWWTVLPVLPSLLVLPVQPVLFSNVNV